jgi:1-acyl-sn-glycerol-3-phosphate acyltransferase
MRMRQRLARSVLRATGWHVVGQIPDRGVLVCAPHTSNWDFVVTLLVMWSLGAPLRVLMKRELFRGPLAVVLRRWGGIPVDRARPEGLVEELATGLRDDERFLLIVAAEGTRRKAEYWKSGFYRLAVSSGLPVTMGFVDGPSRTAGFGPTWHPTGDVRADMDVVRAFYADKRGIRPERRTEPRLRSEAAACPDSDSDSDPDPGAGAGPAA